MRVTEKVRRSPLTLRIYATITLLWLAAFLALARGYETRHPVNAGVWSALYVAAVGALVIWRQAWAWALLVVTSVAFCVAPVWGGSFHPFWDGVELVLIGLLLSPPTRRYLWESGRPRWPFGPLRGWRAPLALSAALTLIGAIPHRHPVEHSIGARIVSGVIFWLLLAAALRLVGFIIQSAGRLGKRRDGTPPATGPQS